MTRREILATAEKCVCGDREEDYGSLHLDRKAVDVLITETVRQAVADWRALCKCKRADKDCWTCKGVERKKNRPTCAHMETRDCNFTELELFFESGCAGYISQGAAERIYRKLKEERRRHENALQNQSVRGVAAAALSGGQETTGAI